MGDTLKKEFQPGQVITGYQQPDPSAVIDTASFGGQVPQPVPQARPTFLSAFLQNLGPALAGGAGQPSFGAGIGGALQGIEEQKRYKQQQEFQQSQLQRQSEQDQLNRQKTLAEITKLGQPMADVSLTPFEDWRKRNPLAPTSDWLKLEQSLKPTAGARNQRIEIEDPTNPGKPVFANYDPDAGVVTDQATGKVIPNPRPFRAAPQMAPESSEAIDIAARALANGDLTKLTSISSMRGEQRILIYAKAKQLNPKFNPSTVDRQLKMLDLYTIGKQGDQLQSFGTFLEHAGALEDVFGYLKNTNQKILNTPINAIRKNTNNPAYRQVITALEPVQKEFETYLLNNRALYADDRRVVDEILNENLSPNDMKAALEQMGHTVVARYNEAGKRFRNTMGASMEELIGPLPDEATEGARKIGVRLGTTQRSQAGPRIGEVQGGYRYKGGDPAQQSSWEKVQ